jgi:y4mF family transcriptional regulator
VDQVRASLRLPTEPLDRIAAQTGKAMEGVAGRLAQGPDARDLARASARAAPADGDRSPARSLLPVERVGDNLSRATIASTRDLGHLVREAREERGLSQQAFADLAGVGRRFISELENGKPTLELGKVLQVAAAAGIDVLARRR